MQREQAAWTEGQPEGVWCGTILSGGGGDRAVGTVWCRPALEGAGGHEAASLG